MYAQVYAQRPGGQQRAFKGKFCGFSILSLPASYSNWQQKKLVPTIGLRKAQLFYDYWRKQTGHKGDKTSDWKHEVGKSVCLRQPPTPRSDSNQKGGKQFFIDADWLI